MRRRDLIVLLGAAAVASQPTARAQQNERVRRVGVLIGISGEDPDAQARYAGFMQRLQQLGWVDGRNIRVDTRWGASKSTEMRKHAAELVALQPDVILAVGSTSVGPLRDATRTIPIIFSIVIDPVGAGYVDSLAHPGGNTTGFMMFEYGLSGKWLELLKQIAPGVTRVGVLRDPTTPAGIGQFAIIQSVAPNFGVEVSAINLNDAPEIERAVTAFANAADGGLIVTAGPWSVVHHELIITLSARRKLPAIYHERLFAAAGGLMSYGANFADEYRRAADYVSRVLNGAKPTELPVQAPTKYELSINLKTATALGLQVPQQLLARADEVIE